MEDLPLGEEVTPRLERQEAGPVSGLSTAPVPQLGGACCTSTPASAG